MRQKAFHVYSLVALLLALFSISVQAQLSDITQPGDPIVGTSNNTPGSEGVANAIDNQPTKYLNFDRLNTGFTVTPRVGLSVVQMLTLTSANDAPERDPASYKLEGSYDGSNFVVIAEGAVPAFTNRFQKVVAPFDNNTPYLSYRLTFPQVVGPGGNSMQISEVELLGFLAPTDVTQPGDAIVGTSNNTPGSEGVANAIDNQPTKYLNFDRVGTGFTVTPSVGGTLVSGITLTSANDAPERDPATYTLEGSLDGVTFYPIASGAVPAFPSRFYKNYIFFPNSRAFAAYRLVFPTVTGPGGNSMQISEVELLGVVSDLAQDVTQPGDPIVGTSNNTPGSEGVANAIDNQPTKYLNFDRLGTGFTVAPRSGLTIVSGLTLTSANDAPERDPADYLLEGSYDGSNFVAIASGAVPAFPSRFFKNTILFENKIPYLQYKLTFPNVVGPGGNSMQISEVELLGVLAPTDVTVPGDAIVGTSNNTPGSEGVANAIDNQPTKYLNFDRVGTGFTVTPGVGDTIVSGLSLTSANDAPERDPATYALSGSVDGANYLPISSGSVPAFTARFQKRYVFFPGNTKAFKSYRLIFPDVTGPGGNSMQISEVEFLGVTPGVVNTNEIETLIRRQPQDTPVLVGSAATFRVGLTGPWKVQWYRNGNRIPGANNATYTIASAVQADDGAVFYAVAQSPQGMQRSSDAMLSIFSPSAVKSIGLSFQGSGANGAPTAMQPSDITGFHPQAYWNNLAGGSGTLNTPNTSDNTPHSSINVTWATSGEWGAGTGNSDPTERLLNGMATSASTDEASAQTITFSGVPAGSHTLFVHTVQVPQEFFNMNFVAVTHGSAGDVLQRRYIRPQNSDEHNASPGFSLVTASTAQTRGVGNMLRFDGLQAGADGVIEVRFYSPGRVDLPGGDPIRGPGVNAVQLVLDLPSAGDAPAITRQPVSANAIVGGQVTLLVEASGPNLAYQWLRNGLVINGANEPELTLSNLQTNDVGSYSVVVSNPAGRVASRTVTVGVVSSSQLTAGLSVYLPLNDGGGDGATAANLAPGGQAGHISGGADFQPGEVANGLALNGADTYVLVPNYTKVGANMTVAGWVSSFTGEGPLVNNWVEGQTTGSSGQFLVDLFLDNGVPSVRAQIEVGPNRVLATAPLTLEQADPFLLHHFAMTANGVTMTIYWDGQLLTAVDYLGTINSTPSIPWLAVGANLGAGSPPPVTGTPFYGQLDEIGLWGRTLSDIEVVGLYNGGLAGKALPEIPAVLNINRSPIANPDSAVTGVAQAVEIDVLANDSDPDAGDVLTLVSVTVPAHGTASITTNSTVAYVPAAGFAGSDSFSYRINDGHGGIASGLVTVTVRDAIPPVVSCPGDITATATSDTGVAVNFTATASDAGSGLQSLVCAPASGSTFAVGETIVTCTARDNAGNSASCSFKVTVTRDTGNHCPVAVANVGPGVDVFLCGAETVVIAGDYSGIGGTCTDGTARVQLDGTDSRDADGNTLTYSWFLVQDSGAVVPVGSGATASTVLEPGMYTIRLVVDDGHCQDHMDVDIHVITPAEGIAALVDDINSTGLGSRNRRPLISLLKSASACYDRCLCESGVKQLNAFINKVRAQVEPSRPEVAADLVAKAQALLDATTCGSSTP